jgi:hypothetical protein
MPAQPNPAATPARRPTVPLPHALPPRTARQLREQQWKALVGTYRLLSRLAVENSRHHFADSADELAKQAALIDEDLEHIFPTRWPRRRAELLEEAGQWWVEVHADDVLACTTCRFLNGMPQQRIDVPPRRRIWA